MGKRSNANRKRYKLNRPLRQPEPYQVVWGPGKLVTSLWDLFLRESSQNVAKGVGQQGNHSCQCQLKGRWEGRWQTKKGGAPPNFLVIFITSYEQSQTPDMETIKGKGREWVTEDIKSKRDDAQFLFFSSFPLTQGEKLVQNALVKGRVGAVGRGSASQWKNCLSRGTARSPSPCIHSFFVFVSQANSRKTKRG